MFLPHRGDLSQEGTLLLDGKSPQQIGYTQWRAQVTCLHACSLSPLTLHMGQHSHSAVLSSTLL